MTEIDQYTLVEMALMTKLRTLTDLFPDPAQVSDNDADLNTGADYFAIFQPGSFPGTRANGMQVDVNWEVVWDFYVRYTTRKESLPKFKAGRSRIFNLISPFCLNKTAGVTKTILSMNGPLVQDVPGDNPNWIIATFSTLISQRVTFDY